MIWISLLLVLLALAVFWLANRQRKQTGLPGGRVVYTDVGKWQPTSQPLYDPNLNLAGKPDYIVFQDGTHVPIEVKSRRTPRQHYNSHIFQLATYCYLIEVTTGQTPQHGILHYPQETFEVKYTPELRASLLSLIEDMRTEAQHEEGVSLFHEHPARCARCSFLEICEAAMLNLSLPKK